MSSEGLWHFFWCIWSCLPAPFLSPTPAATGCVVPIAPSPAPFSLLQEEVTVDTFSVHPLMNAGKSTVFFTSRSRHSSALPWQVCINYLCLPSLTFLAQCSWQTNKTDGIQWRQSEMERSDFPVIFTPSTLFQHYWVTQSYLLKNTSLGSEPGGTCIHLWPEGEAMKYHQRALLLQSNAHPRSSICFRHLFHLEGIKKLGYPKCFVYIKTWGVNEYLKPFQ